MGDPLGFMEALVKAASVFGAVGTVCLILAVLMGFFYRRDFMKERRDHLEQKKTDTVIQARLLDVLEKQASNAERLGNAVDKNTDTLESLGRTIERSDENTRRQMDLLVSALQRERVR